MVGIGQSGASGVGDGAEYFCRLPLLAKEGGVGP